MNDYEAKRICFVIGVIVLIWFISSKFNIHTGGNETYTSNRGIAAAFSLVGDANAMIGHGSGKVMLCPNCGATIELDQ